MKTAEYKVSKKKLAEVTKRLTYYGWPIPEGSTDCEIWEMGNFEFHEWEAEQAGKKTYEEFYGVKKPKYLG